ncbi:glycosyltransferase family 39 protein [soil metagenome]
MANRIPLAWCWFFFALGIFLIGNQSHSFWDRDEPRYAEATREMLDSGDWIIPHFNGEIRYDKPPLSYWLMAGPMKVFGVNEFAARFPAAVLGAVRTVLIFLLAVRLGCSLAGASVAALGSTLMIILTTVSKAATTDSILVLTVAAAMFCRWEMIARGSSFAGMALLGAALGSSALVKGPVGPSIVLLAILTHAIWDYLAPGEKNSAKSQCSKTVAQAALGLGVFMLVALPWAVATLVKGSDFLTHSFQRHVVERVESASEGHEGPSYYYLVLLPLLILPLTPVALAALPHVFKSRRSATMRFLICWIVPSFMMFSAVSTKLPHYVAPLVPAICLMAGLWWTERERGAQNIGSRGWMTAGACFMALVGVGGAVALPLAVKNMNAPVGSSVVYTVSAVLFVSMLSGAWFWVRGAAPKALAAWCAGWTAVLLIAMVWALPSIDALRPSRQLALWLHHNAPAGTRVIANQYKEPTFVFYQGGGVEMRGIRSADRRDTIKGLNKIQVPTALVTTRDRYDTMLEENEIPINPRVRPLLDKEFFQFEQGRFIRMVIVGNWLPPE